jgi:hypothetical protein
LDSKVQTIEKLFFYSYLIIPLCLLFFINKKKEAIPYILGFYGLLFFCFLKFYEFLPNRKFIQLFYTFLEYFFFALIFWLNIKNKKFRVFISIFTFSFLVFLVFYYFNSKLARLDSIPIGIETILTLVYISFFFYESFKTSVDSYIYNHHCFWVSIGILLYLGGSFFFYILINDLPANEVKTFGNLTFIAEIIKNILFSIAVIIYYKSLRLDASKKSIPYLDMV